MIRALRDLKGLEEFVSVARFHSHVFLSFGSICWALQPSVPSQMICLEKHDDDV